MGPQSDLAVLPAPKQGRAHPSKARFCDVSVFTQPPQPQLKRERGVGRGRVGDARRADASVPGAAPLNTRQKPDGKRSRRRTLPKQALLRPSRRLRKIHPGPEAPRKRSTGLQAPRTDASVAPWRGLSPAVLKALQQGRLQSDIYSPAQPCSDLNKERNVIYLPG